jgi:hypothetical protein|tara:strand:+ start:58 stop:342 length:285 start_codon:yes stop_codon:yes gene_type:complete
MKKLNKRQEKIIDTINTSLSTSFLVLNDFKLENDFDMVRHMQKEIVSKLDGIIYYVIFHNHKDYKALEKRFDEMRKNPELKFEWAMEIVEEENA